MESQGNKTTVKNYEEKKLIKRRTGKYISKGNKGLEYHQPQISKHDKQILIKESPHDWPEITVNFKGDREEEGTMFDASNEPSYPSD